MPALEFDDQTFNNPVELTPLGETVLPCIDVLRTWGA